MPDQSAAPPPSDRTRVQRVPERGVYDPQTIHDILDEALVVHVAFPLDRSGGAPAVIPTACWRMGDQLLFHGASSSRTLKALRQGAPCCATVTLLDEIVLARAGFHHSMNYRSVVVYGQASELTDDDEILAALHAFTEKLAPGRWQALRPPTPQELKATAVFALPLSEASAKVRSGPPIDDEADYDLPVWAGVVPLFLAAGDPIADPRYTGPEKIAPVHAFHLGRESAP